MMDDWRQKRILITGVAGTVGRELLSQLAVAQPAEIIGLDNNESEIFFLRQAHSRNESVRLYLADIRDARQLSRHMDAVDIVLHTAAYKHVYLCEQAPHNAVQTNILGTQNVIDAALENEVDRVIFTSSDKAVNPTSVMGTSKLMGERLMTAANALRRSHRPVFAASRFGNVLGSRGSVVPLFAQQIARGGPVTLTHPEMTRFIMTLSGAVKLVMEAVFLAQGGEVFVTKMPVARIQDLASVMIAEMAPRWGHRPQDIPIETIGTIPGEKLYEELMNQEETRRTIELERYFVVLPALRAVYNQSGDSYADSQSAYRGEAYNSSNVTPMTPAELRAYMLASGLLSEAPAPAAHHSTAHA